MVDHFVYPNIHPWVNSVNINQQYQLPAEVQRLQTWQPHELGYGTRPYGCTTFGGIAPSRSQWVLYSYPKVSQKAGALDDLFLWVEVIHASRKTCSPQRKKNMFFWQYITLWIYIYILHNIYIHIYICSMYVCMYVCMYLSIYVSMYLCIYLSIYLFIYLSISIYVSMYVCNVM